MQNPSVTQYSQFTAAENERLRETLRGLMADRGWSGARAAREMGVSPNTVASFLREINGAGEALIQGLERVTKRTREQLLDRAPALGVRLDALPGFREALADAVLFARVAWHDEDVRPEDFAEVGAWVVPAPIPLEASALAYMARAVAVRRRSQAGGGASTPPPSNDPKTGR